ncbi:MAG: MurR/RpiR family transcriptional regulator [Clostridiales bacterium]|nr:MurR/RpiR family transcriptional regulator [Clostridiales bacterium]
METKNDIISVISSKSAAFSKGQKKIANYILKNRENAAYMTAARLSQGAGVSEATVIRFAYELGLNGYPELQKRLIDHAKTQLTSLQRMKLACEKIGSRDILYSILKSDVGYIEKTLENIDKSQFEKAAAAISSANKIYITGVRSAASLAEFAGFYLHLIFDNVRLIKSTGGDGLFEQILNVGEGDAFIGISFPRYSKNTIKALEYAKKNGATVIGITDSKSSPVALMSDFTLIAWCDTTSFIDSLTAPFSLINALLVAVGMANMDKVRNNLERLEQIWDEYEVYDRNDG